MREIEKEKSFIRKRSEKSAPESPKGEDDVCPDCGGLLRDTRCGYMCPQCGWSEGKCNQ